MRKPTCGKLADGDAHEVPEGDPKGPLQGGLLNEELGKKEHRVRSSRAVLMSLWLSKSWSATVLKCSAWSTACWLNEQGRAEDEDVVVVVAVVSKRIAPTEGKLMAELGQ